MDKWRVRFEPVITPVFRAWWRLSRPLTIGVRVLATNDASHIMLVKHSYASGWHMPGGGVEQGEAVGEAARRELAEEAGLEAADAPKLLHLYVNTNFKNDHIALFHVERWTPCVPRGGPEIIDRGFFPRDALPDGVTKATLRRLAEVFDGAPPSATW